MFAVMYTAPEFSTPDMDDMHVCVCNWTCDSKLTKHGQ